MYKINFLRILVAIYTIMLLSSCNSGRKRVTLDNGNAQGKVCSVAQTHFEGKCFTFEEARKICSNRGHTFNRTSNKCEAEDTKTACQDKADTMITPAGNCVDGPSYCATGDNDMEFNPTTRSCRKKSIVAGCSNPNEIKEKINGVCEVGLTYCAKTSGQIFDITARTCKACKSGEKVENNKCVVAGSAAAECPDKKYFKTKIGGVCKIGVDHCKAKPNMIFEGATQDCKACQNGYEPKNNICVKANITPVIRPGTYDLPGAFKITLKVMNNTSIQTVFSPKTNVTNITTTMVPKISSGRITGFESSVKFKYKAKKLYCSEKHVFLDTKVLGPTDLKECQ